MKDWGAGAKYLQILSWLPEIWITSGEVSVQKKSAKRHYLKGEWFSIKKENKMSRIETSQKTSFNALKVSNCSSHWLKILLPVKGKVMVRRTHTVYVITVGVNLNLYLQPS